MKILSLLIGVAVGAGAGMYYQKKQDDAKYDEKDRKKKRFSKICPFFHGPRD